MSAWIPFTGTAKGTFVKGDPDVKPTTKFNRWWMSFYGWKKVAVFEAKLPNSVDPFFVGFRSYDGTAELYQAKQRHRVFRTLNRHEAGAFFAVNEDGEEIPLVLIRVVPRNDPAYAGAPLI